MSVVSEVELHGLTAALQEAVVSEVAALQEMETYLRRLRRVCDLVRIPELTVRLEALVAAVEARSGELAEAEQLLRHPAPSAPVAGGSKAVSSSSRARSGTAIAPHTVSPANSRVKLKESRLDPARDWLSPSQEPTSDAQVAAGISTLNGTAGHTQSGPKELRPLAWEPRPLEALETVLQQSKEQLNSLGEGEPRTWAHFKAIAAVYRGAQLERQRHPGSQDAWYEFQRTLRELQRQLWPDLPCLPLYELNLAPREWEQLSELYAQLGEAQAALDWLEEAALAEAEAWLGRDAMGVLEASAAILTRLWRWMQAHLPGRREEQLQALYERVRLLTAPSRTYLRSLQSADLVGDPEIEALAADLPLRLGALQESTTRRRRKMDALATFRTWVEAPGWGSREGDDERTCALAVDCLRAGVPATDKQLRDPLLDCPWMLEEEPELARLADAVRSEAERREKLGEPVTPVPDEAISVELAEMLTGVLPMTNGLRAVIVGGQPREDTRKAIQESLELTDLKWPATDPADTFERSRAAIRKADLVFLTRFNRRKAREAYRICNEEDKLLVVLPKGYGLHEVIYRMHLRLGGDSLQAIGS